MKANYDKFHLLIPYHDDDVYINIGMYIIKGSKSEKLIGIDIDNNLRVDKYDSTLCDKASQKLHALARISKDVSDHKWKVLIKSFVLSQFGYCPLVWMFHRKTLHNRINRLHGRALKIAYKDNFSNFQELLDKNNSYTIHKRNLKFLAVEMYKIQNGLAVKMYKIRNGYLLKCIKYRMVYLH